MFCFLYVQASFHYQFREYFPGKKLIDVGYIINLPGATNIGVCIALAYKESLVIWTPCLTKWLAFCCD